MSIIFNFYQTAIVFEKWIHSSKISTLQTTVFRLQDRNAGYRTCQANSKAEDLNKSVT
jgi:hypothetical protein